MNYIVPFESPHLSQSRYSKIKWLVTLYGKIVTKLNMKASGVLILLTQKKNQKSQVSFLLYIINSLNKQNNIQIPKEGDFCTDIQSKFDPSTCKQIS